MTWRYPVISSGLIYVVDINQGLLALRYHGPHEDEAAGSGFAEGQQQCRRRDGGDARRQCRRDRDQRGAGTGSAARQSTATRRRSAYPSSPGSPCS